jgi:hypothetical protein
MTCKECNLPICYPKRKFCSTDCKFSNWNRENKVKKAASVKKYSLAHPEQRRAIKLKKYGITPKQYDEMSVAQEHLCKICRQKCKTERQLAVDHCHKTGKVRGLLCKLCNSLLGSARDDISILENSIKYLKDSL